MFRFRAICCVFNTCMRSSYVASIDSREWYSAVKCCLERCVCAIAPRLLYSRRFRVKARG